MFRLYKIAIPCLVALVVFELWIISSGLNKSATASTDQFPETLSHEVVQRFEQEDADSTGRYIVELRDDFSFDYRQLSTNPDERRVQVIQQRQTNSLNSINKMNTVLMDLEEESLIKSSEPLWIINGFVIEGEKEGILALAHHPDVEEIRVDAVVQQIEPLDADASQSTEQTDINWGLVNSRVYDTWHGLNTTGEGVTIAIMDTGVDFEHPALRDNYRGRNPDGSVDHAGNWFHAAIPTTTIPIDTHGHGTHVAGTAVGGQNLGVAPDAEWIAVAIGDNAGFILESYVHAAFEWMLQPNGDPSLAPDIINGSWGGPSENADFQENIELVHAAGIIPVFATGNNGPQPGTINTPAAFRDVIAVGATDISDNLTWFTARGPSIFTDQPRPVVSAPGATVYSALPEDSYGYMSGTSMATPHVAGGLALLLSANPNLNVQEIQTLLQQTARPFSSGGGPNSGYGIMDTHALVASQLPNQVGRLQGTLLADSEPIANGLITVTTSSSDAFVVTTDASGSFAIDLVPGTYQLTASQFGYSQNQAVSATVTSGSSTIQNVSLRSDPSGRLSGTITNSQNSTGVDAELILVGTDQRLQIGENGTFDWELPVGTYDVQIWKNGFAIVEKVITITDGQTITLNQALNEQPTVLFVESGAWRYANETNAVPAALTANHIAFDTHEIEHLVDDMVISDTLNSYDVVVWSSTKFSPGYIDAGGTISDYLDAGGNLILIGPNIALYDANSQSSDFVEEYMRQGLDIRSGSRLIPTQTIVGVEASIFNQLSFELADPVDPSTELYVSEIDIRPYSFSKPILAFEQDPAQLAEPEEESYIGIEAGHCKSFKSTLLGFNLRDVNSPTAQLALIENSFDFFAAPPTQAGLEWLTPPSQDFAVQGEASTYELYIRNMSETVTETVSISLSGGVWTNEILTPTLTIPPCGVGVTGIQITPNQDAEQNETQQLTVTASAKSDAAVSESILIEQKTPGTVLLVDDHRWYDQRDKYGEALEALGMEYDVWQTSGEERRGSPSISLLKKYDFVIWYTAYDWFEPVSQKESETLIEYLNHGGRVYLSSQDFMFYNAHHPLTKQYFGVSDYMESVTPTFGYNNDVFQVSENVSDVIPIVYDEYRNNADSLIYGPDATPALWHNKGVGGVANSGSHNSSHWRAMFWSLPFETFPREMRLKMMENIVGWLGDLGDSTFEVDQIDGSIDVPRTYTITLKNAALTASHAVTVTNALPLEITPDSGSLTGGALYDAETHTISWVGVLPSRGEHQISYRAVTEADGVINNAVSIEYGPDQILLTKNRAVLNNLPNLTASVVDIDHNAPQADEIDLIYKIRLENGGVAAAEGVSATTTLSEGLSIITGTLQTTSGEVDQLLNWIYWNGQIEAGEAVTITFHATSTQQAHSTHLITNVRLSDSEERSWFVYDQTEIKAFEAFAPFIQTVVNRD